MTHHRNQLRKKGSTRKFGIGKQGAPIVKQNHQHILLLKCIEVGAAVQAKKLFVRIVVRKLLKATLPTLRIAPSKRIKNRNLESIEWETVLRSTVLRSNLICSIKIDTFLPTVLLKSTHSRGKF